MKIKGRRECQDCGTVWSYYETGDVSCPDCGSLRSVGVDDRTRHTDGPTELDLSAHQGAVADGDLEGVADDLKADLREYVRRRGFIHAGDLRPLDDRFLAAHELIQAVDVRVRTGTPGRGGAGLPESPDAEEELYLLALLRGASEGDRPATADVPASMAAPRGLAYARAVDEYRGELATWLEDHPDPEARRTLGRLRDRVKRIEALEGDVPLEHSEALVGAARELGEYLAGDDESALATARDRLSRLE